MPRPDAKIQKDLRKKFAVSMKQIRLERNMSMGEMARRLDLSVPMIMKYERAQSLPSIETLIEMAKRLSVGVDDLLGNERPQKATKK